MPLLTLTRPSECATRMLHRLKCSNVRVLAIYQSAPEARERAAVRKMEKFGAGNLPRGHSLGSVTGKKDTSGLLCGFLNNPQRVGRA